MTKNSHFYPVFFMFNSLIWDGTGTPEERLWNACRVYLKHKISKSQQNMPHAEQSAQRPFFTGKILLLVHNSIECPF